MSEMKSIFKALFMVNTSWRGTGRQVLLINEDIVKPIRKCHLAQSRERPFTTVFEI